MKNIIAIAIWTGLVGDYLLKYLVKSLHLGGTTGWGLIPYFKQHGSNESAFTAAGMMGVFYAIYLIIPKISMNYFNLAVYGIALDLLFRKTMLFPSLKGYYAALNYFWSAVWGAIPMMLPYFIAQVIY